MKVQGKGSVKMEPDVVTLSFDVESKARDYEESVRNLNARVDNLRESMMASGLDKAHLKTTLFDVHVERNYKDGQRIFTGYIATHRMQIELSMEKELLNKVLRHVAQGHSGAEINLSFSVRDKEALRKKVLTNAVKAARENAETLAAAAGVKLAKMVQMDYGWSEVRIYDQEASMVAEGDAEMSTYDADIEPEDVAAEDKVTLVFQITE